MSQGIIYTNITNKVGTITFGHPKSNSFPSALLQKLIDSIGRLDLDNKVQVIVLKSEGEKTFCAGASFDELLQIKDIPQGKQFFSGFANLINAMRKCSKTIVARVHGKVVGGGVGIVAAADYVFATEAASIKLSELSIGIGPFVIEPAITRKIGIAAMNELALNPTEWKTGYWAQNKGLFAKVFENRRDMDKGLDVFVSNLVSYNPKALAELKKIAWQNTAHWDQLLLERAAISGTLVLSDLTKNALSKFKS